jgi:hypothetical protein
MSRKGQGRPVDRSGWPAVGARREWLAYCDEVHRGNGLPSLRQIAGQMRLVQPTRVNDMLRARSWPADEAQARALVEALGAVGAEVERGMRLYRRACKERDQRLLDEQRPGWWLRSGYVAQVGDIAPIVLLDRQAELDELAAWCTGGDDPYVWWQAPARAGKSALMAWLVLHPPPGVWVVSFFVTARLVSQADSTAFTDGLLDQLAAITEEHVPPLTSVAQRDRLRRQLLGEALARADRAGCRLVLLVDGLDEDCGSHAGSGLASVASLLPKRPPNGLRVIVAGRPDPPIPADVDLDHPLRRCPVRVLDASPHAGSITALAEQELDEVLSTDPSRHDGLGYEVLGLVTACGGGLDREDLQELTGRAGFEIDRLLRGVFGRTIAGRADPHNSRPVFLFTHETLRGEAVDRLGEVVLTGFRDRIRRWAARYQQRGWPAGTPLYLLLGYPRMLADLGDVSGLVTLATDTARHDRMLETTGADAAALAEIAAAQVHICDQDVPDLLAAVRLARRRDQLADRNANIPIELPTLWVTLGRPVRAEALARSITKPVAQAWALLKVVSAVADGGDHPRAEDIAWSLADPRRRTEALASVAMAAAAAGNRQYARDLASKVETHARSIPDLRLRAEALATVASASAAVGDHQHAQALATDVQTLARSITDGPWQDYLLAEAASALAATGAQRAAEVIVRSITNKERRLDPLARVMCAFATAGDHQQAQALAAEVHTLAESIAHFYWQDVDGALASVASTVAAAGDRHLAERIIRSITYPSSRMDPLVYVALRAAAAGDHQYALALADEAEALARSITYPNAQADGLLGVASAIAAVGDRQYARGLAAEAEAIIRSSASPHSKANTWADQQAAVELTLMATTLTRLATTVAAAGDHQHALDLAVEIETLARSIPDRYSQIHALVEVLPALAAGGELQYARALVSDLEALAQQITEPYARNQALASLASMLAATGDCQRAEDVARSITDPHQVTALVDVTSAIAATGDYQRAQNVARSIADPYPQAEALTCVASAVAAAGDYARARAMAHEVESLARSIADPNDTARALAGVVSVASMTGDHLHARSLVADAQSIAQSGTPGSLQARAFCDLAKVVTQPHAIRLLLNALSVGRWTIALPALAHIDQNATLTAIHEYLIAVERDGFH